MTEVALIAGGRPCAPARDFDVYVGIDGGSLWLLQHGFPLDLAVGDFDSVTVEELALIGQQAGKMIQAPSEKNDTDTELAVKTVLSQYPKAVLTIYGVFGGRIDHTLSNIFLPSDPAIAPYMQQISLVDEQNRVCFLPAGTHQLQPVKDMTYISFMTSDSADLVIKGAKYELTGDNFFKKKIYSSNEFTNQPIEVTVATGYVIAIQSKDKKWSDF
ncbi:thiamine diphosphokinase [Streptococcus dentasini]